MKQDSKYNQCPACSSSDLQFNLKVNYWREFLLSFDRCENCGATFSNPMPDDETIRMGNDAYIRYFEQGRTWDSDFREARQSYLRGKLMGRKLSRWKRSGRLLELGCNHGFYSLGIQDHSEWEVEGLEISHDLAKNINAHFGFKCHEGTFESLRLPENHYDFIICHDLIEHINRPEIFIQNIFKILKPGGRIQIITPNAHQDLAPLRRMFAQGYTPHMLLNHIFYFTPESLKTALVRTGLKVVREYCYYIQQVFKDFGWLGLGKITGPAPEAPSARETLKLPEHHSTHVWSQEKLQELRSHPKVSGWYGFYRETLPEFFTVKVPASFKIGHEIYMLAEKPTVKL